MRKMFTVGSLLLLGASTAFAQTGGDPGKKPAPAPAVKPADPAKPSAPPAGGDAMMAAPKPAEEMKQLKDMVGVWKCEGKMVMGGKEIPEKSGATFTWDLDKHFLSARYDSPKTKENPTGYKGRVMYGWDPVAKQFVAMGVDNMGGISVMTSKGWSGETMEWTGKTKAMGKEHDAHQKVMKTGPREVALSGGMGSGAEAMTWESTCKK